MQRSTLFWAAIVVAVVAVAAPALAEDGQIPIPFASPYATPITITEPGSYKVTRLLTKSGAGPLIVIDCNAGGGGAIRMVQIDFNGYRAVDSVGSATPIVRVDDTNQVCEIVIRNGGTYGGSIGIDAPNVRSLRVEDMQIRNAGAGVNARTVDILTVRRTQIVNSSTSGGIGINASAGNIVKTAAIIEDSVVYNTNTWGILVGGRKQARIVRNHIEDTGRGSGGTAGSGIECRPCWTAHIADNNLSDNGGNAILVAPDPADTTRNSRSFEILNNTLHRNGDLNAGTLAGITLQGFPPAAGGGIVGWNTVDNQKNGAGIRISDMDGVMVRDNVLTLANTSWGLRIDASASNTGVTRNLMSANAGGACAGSPSPPQYCSASATTVSLGDNIAAGAGAPF